jgi:cobalt/nickel transport protein
VVTKEQKTIIVGLVVALIFVVIGVFVLSYSMETLDKQAEQLGSQENPIYEPPFPDYLISGVNETLGGLIIGIGGTLLLFFLGFAVAKVLSKKKKTSKQ